MQAVIYARVSTQDQADDGHSLDAQQRLLTHYAEQRGFTVAKIFAVPESASGTRERKTFQEMLQFAGKQRISIILCEKVDRITRNFKEAVVINDWLEKEEDRQLHLVKQNLIISKSAKSHEKLQWDMQIVMARHYINNLREEVSKGQDEGARQGLYPGTSKIGYISHGKRGKSANGVARKMHPIEGPKIREIFQRLAVGTPASEVFAWATQIIQLKNTNGSPIPRSRFYTLIRDPFYCGKFSWRGKLYAGKHEAIISPQLFRDVQDILDGRRNVKKQVCDYIFQGVLCDETTQRPYSVSTNKGYAYYHVRSGRGAYLPETKVDRAFIEWLQSMEITDAGIIQLQTALKAFIKTSHADRKEARREYELKLQALDRQLETAELKLLDGVLTDTRYRAISKRVEEERAAIFFDLPATDTAKNDACVAVVGEFVELIQTLKNKYEILPARAKANFAKIVLLNSYVRDGKVYFIGKKHAEAVLNLPKNASGA